MLWGTLIFLVLVGATRGWKDDLHDFGSFYENDIQPRFNIEDIGAHNLGPEEEKGSDFWIKKAQRTIKEKLKEKPIVKKAKNVIFFIGDGMSIPTMTAARIYDSQRKGNLWGEENVLSFERFPYSGQVKTYCTNAQVADSACSATAYHSGIKTNTAVVGVNGNVSINDCKASSDPVNQVDSILKWAQDSCKSTGFVTTTRVTHSSPSPLYAHSASKDWESDADLEEYGQDPRKCQDIASQLINNAPGNRINVILGGGRDRFLPRTNRGLRKDGQDLISKWRDTHPTGQYVSNKRRLIDARNNKSVTDILGLFKSSHLDYFSDSDKATQPSLTEMVETAVEVLSRNSNGFYLFVEGGRIDTAHDDNKLRQSLEETKEFSRSVDRVLNLVNLEETLVVVSADHSQAFGIAGYPKRGNDIAGLSDPTRDSKDVPYSTINYIFGPQQYRDSEGERIDLEEEFENADMNFIYPSMTPTTKGHHAGDDVAIFAVGPYAHLFTGVFEQSAIPELMSFAACIGKGLTHCQMNKIPTDSCQVPSTKCDPSDLNWKAVSGSCTDFKFCVRGTWVQKTCSKGFMFNEQKGYCIKATTLCPQAL